MATSSIGGRDAGRNDEGQNRSARHSLAVGVGRGSPERGLPFRCWSAALGEGQAAPDRKQQQNKSLKGNSEAALRRTPTHQHTPEADAAASIVGTVAAAVGGQ